MNKSEKERKEKRQKEKQEFEAKMRHRDSEERDKLEKFFRTLTDRITTHLADGDLDEFLKSVRLAIDFCDNSDIMHYHDAMELLEIYVKEAIHRKDISNKILRIVDGETK